MVGKHHPRAQELYLLGFEKQYMNKYQEALEAWQKSAELGHAGAHAALGFGLQEFEGP